MKGGGLSYLPVPHLLSPRQSGPVFHPVMGDCPHDGFVILLSCSAHLPIVLFYGKSLRTKWRPDMRSLENRQTRQEAGPPAPQRAQMSVGNAKAVIALVIILAAALMMVAIVQHLI